MLIILQKIRILIQVCWWKNTIVAVPCHSGFHPSLSSTFWHVHLRQHMCVCTTLGLSVWDFVCDPFWLCRPTAWHSSSVCVFSLLMRPLMIREGSVAHTHTRTNTKPGQTQRHQAPGRHIYYHNLGSFHGSLNRKSVRAPACSCALPLLLLIIQFLCKL